MSIKHFRARGGLRRSIAMGITLATAASVFTACSADSSTESAGTGKAVAEAVPMKIGELSFDPTKYCGDKPMKIGDLSGNGSNTWNTQVRAVLANFKSYCDNITEMQYFDATGDVARYNNALNTWAAQGFNVVFANSGSFGKQTLPAFRSAQQTGVKVGASSAPLGDDVVPTTVSASVVTDFQSMASEFVQFLADAKPEGTSNILLIGGTAGNPQDVEIMEDSKKAIADTGANVKFLQDTPVIGNYDIATSAQATAAAIAKYPEIDGVMLSYAAVAPSIMRAFQNAGRPIPTIVGTGVTSEVVCTLDAARKTDPNLNMLTLDGSGSIPALALVKAIAAYQGIDAPELGPDDAETYAKLVPYIDTLNNQIPACDPSLPADYDPTMAPTESGTAAVQ